MNSKLYRLDPPKITFLAKKKLLFFLIKKKQESPNHSQHSHAMGKGSGIMMIIIIIIILYRVALFGKMSDTIYMLTCIMLYCILYKVMSLKYIK